MASMVTNAQKVAFLSVAISAMPVTSDVLESQCGVDGEAARCTTQIPSAAMIQVVKSNSDPEDDPNPKEMQPLHDRCQTNELEIASLTQRTDALQTAVFGNTYPGTANNGKLLVGDQEFKSGGAGQGKYVIELETKNITIDASLPYANYIFLLAQRGKNMWKNIQDTATIHEKKVAMLKFRLTDLKTQLGLKFLQREGNATTVLGVQLGVKQNEKSDLVTLAQRITKIEADIKHCRSQCEDLEQMSDAAMTL